MARARLSNRLAGLIASRLRLYTGHGTDEGAMLQLVVAALSALVICFGLLIAGETYSDAAWTSWIRTEPVKVLLELGITISGSILALVVAFLLILLSAEEANRIDRTVAREIQSAHALKLDVPVASIRMRVDTGKCYKPPEWLDALLSSLAFDRREYFSLYAGGLDVPKLTLLGLNRVEGGLNFDVSYVSYFHHFYTHLFYDFKLTRERGGESTTLRSVMTSSAEEHYKVLEEYRAGRADSIGTWPDFPSTFGITALVTLKVGPDTFAFFKERGRVSAHSRALQSTLAFVSDFNLVPPSSAKAVPLLRLFESTYRKNFSMPLADRTAKILPQDERQAYKERLAAVANNWLNAAVAKELTFGAALGFQPELLVHIQGDMRDLELPKQKQDSFARLVAGAGTSAFYHVGDSPMFAVKSADIGAFINKNQAADGSSRFRPTDTELLRQIELQ